MKTIQEIKNNFEQILSEVIKINGLPVESATQVAQVILQESGKFERTEMLNNGNGNANSSNNNDKPITQKQIKYLQDLGVLVKPGMTSREASKLIEQSRNGKGRTTAPSFTSRIEVEEIETEKEEQDSEWCPHCDREAHDEKDCPAFASFYDTLGFS